MRVAMQKVDGVQTVRVSLNDGLTILDLKPGNSVTLAMLRQVIKNNGFVSKDAQIVARGSMAVADGRPVFDVSGTKERFKMNTLNVTRSACVTLVIAKGRYGRLMTQKQCSKKLPSAK